MSDGNQRPVRPTQLRTAWLIWTVMLSLPAAYILICHCWGDQIRAATESQPSTLWLRTIFYMIALATFPIINLLRRKMRHYPIRRRGHNAEHGRPTPSDGYYLRIVTLSLALAESIGLWGLILFIFGDNLQTLYLFCGLSVLAMVLYRPKMEELEQLDASIES